jgi:predicted MPP superfamily phosphohydrolase
MYELVFDAIIALVMAAVPLYWVLSWRRRKEGRDFGPDLLGALLTLVWAVVAYGSFVEPRLLVTREHDLPLAAAGESRSRTLTVAVISDLHLGTYRHEEWVRTVVSRVNATNPDLVLLAGDLASNMTGTKEFGPLRDLKSRYGTFAVLGNWDYLTGAVDVRKAIEATGVEVLTNESVAIDVAGRELRLAGLDDVRYGKPDWDAMLAGVPPDAFTVLLVHNPDAAPQAEVRGIPLVIAGHTHAGQIRLPIVGPVPNLPTKLGKDFDRGTFAFGPTRLFITPGVGESGPRARLLAPPEISLLHLTF